MLIPGTMPRWRLTPPWETARDLDADAAVIRRRRYGVIEIVDGRLERIVLRPWPKLLCTPEWWPSAGETLPHDGAPLDRCRLYYNQPRSAPRYLALKYIVSTYRASFASFSRALHVLDAVARIKQSDAIVCEAFNERLSERLLARYGWERHLPTSRRRHYIKRFYGNYPEPGSV